LSSTFLPIIPFILEKSVQSEQTDYNKNNIEHRSLFRSYCQFLKLICQNYSIVVYAKLFITMCEQIDIQLNPIESQWFLNKTLKYHRTEHRFSDKKKNCSTETQIK